MYFLFVSVMSSTECYGFNHLRFNHGSNSNSLEKKKKLCLSVSMTQFAVCSFPKLTTTTKIKKLIF